VRTLIEGDTLAKLAYEYLGDPGAWRAIAEVNNIDNPRKLEPGTALIMPPGRGRRGG